MVLKSTSKLLQFALLADSRHLNTPCGQLSQNVHCVLFLDQIRSKEHRLSQSPKSRYTPWWRTYYSNRLLWRRAHVDRRVGKGHLGPHVTRYLALRLVPSLRAGLSIYLPPNHRSRKVSKRKQSLYLGEKPPGRSALGWTKLPALGTLAGREGLEKRPPGRLTRTLEADPVVMQPHRS